MIPFLICVFIFLPAWSFESNHSNTFQLGYTAYQGRFPSVDSEFSNLNFTSENTFFYSKKSEFKISPALYFWTFQNSHTSHFEGDVKDLNYTYFGRDLTFQVGFFNLKKDGPDVIDPLDTFQPRIWIDPLNKSLFSLGGLRLEYDPFENVVFEFVFVPQNRLSRTPLENSPWYPREKKLPLSNELAIANLPDNPQYVITQNEAEKKSHLQNNYQLKGKFTFDQTDLFLQYNEVLSLTPTITPVLSGSFVSAAPILEVNLTNPIELHIVWSKLKNYSAGVVSAFDAYRLIAKAFVNYQVTSVDKTTLSVVALEKQLDNTAVVFEASKSDTVSDMTSNSTANIYSLYKQAVVLGLRHSFNDDLTILCGGLYDTYKGANFLYLRPKYNLNDQLSIELQAAFLGGKKDSLLWYFDHNDSYSARLYYNF